MPTPNAFTHPSLRTPRLDAAARRDPEVRRFDHVGTGVLWLKCLADQAARIAEVPAAAINLMKSSTQRTVAAVGIEVTVLDRKHSMCDAIIESGSRVHVADVSTDPRWSDNPFVNGTWGNIRFYGAHPLIAPSHFVIGTLCVFDSRPRQLEAHQVHKLDALAATIVDKLERSRVQVPTSSLRDRTNCTTRSK